MRDLSVLTVLEIKKNYSDTFVLKEIYRIIHFVRGRRVSSQILNNIRTIEFILTGWDFRIYTIYIFIADTFSP